MNCYLKIIVKYTKFDLILSYLQAKETHLKILI